jgi:hypothetical protein
MVDCSDYPRLISEDSPSAEMISALQKFFRDISA